MALLDRLKTVLFTAAGLGFCGAAYAKEGQPAPWQLGFQPAATPIMEQIHGFHTYVTVIITLIALFVLFLLVYVMARFNERRNPAPSRTTHNTPLEIAWTVIPVLILVAIAIPSFRLLYAPDQALVDQARQRVELRCTHRFRRLHRPTAGEDRQLTQQLLLLPR